MHGSAPTQPLELRALNPNNGSQMQPFEAVLLPIIACRSNSIFCNLSTCTVPRAGGPPVSNIDMPCKLFGCSSFAVRANLISSCILFKSTFVSMSTTLYQYTPLQEESSFRILYLDRANDHNAPLSLTLRETLLEKARGKFDALSYFWGPRGDIKIKCSGQQISIGPNCEAALRRLRSRIRKVALFVDAICIDQKNDVEKDEQIKLMGHVYHCAKRVLIWLGPGSPRTDLAFKEIRFLYRFRCFLETRDHRPITSDRIERLRTWVWQRTAAHDRTYYTFFCYSWLMFCFLSLSCQL